MRKHIDPITKAKTPCELDSLQRGSPPSLSVDILTKRGEEGDRLSFPLVVRVCVLIILNFGGLKGVIKAKVPLEFR